MLMPKSMRRYLRKKSEWSMDQVDSASPYTWQWPIDLVQYDRSPLLSETERNVLANWSGTTGVRISRTTLFSH